MKSPVTSTQPTKSILQLKNNFVKTKTMQISKLAQTGVKFVRVALGKKAPLEKGWQSNPLSFAEITDWQGNVAVATGSQFGNLVCLDFDNNNFSLAKHFDKLSKTISVTRPNAAGRGKVFFLVIGNLPRSTSWREKRARKSPDIELLSDGRIAVVSGVHPTGVGYEMHGDEIQTLTDIELASVWKDLTGNELYVDESVPRGESGSDLAAQVKDLWSCIDVAERFMGDGETENNGQVRFIGHGGLLIDPVKDVYFCFSDYSGGDAIGLWHWNQTGKHTMDGAEFFETCISMLDAAGVNTDKYVSKEAINWDVALQVFAQPCMYSDGRGNSSEQRLMVALLDVMKRANRTTVKYSAREAAVDADMTKNTASKVFDRLIDLGWIEKASAVTWCEDGDDDRDHRVAKAFDARAYTLTKKAISSVIETDTVLPFSGDDSTVSVSITPVNPIDGETFGRYLNYAPFAHGAKIIGTSLSIGRIGLLAVSAMVANGEMTSDELVLSTGKSAGSIRRICNTLEMLGLVEIDRSRKEIVYSLVFDWADVLESYRDQVTKAISLVKRAIQYAEERIIRLGGALGNVLSKGLKGGFLATIKKLRQRVYALNLEIKRIETVQKNIFA